MFIFCLLFGGAKIVLAQSSGLIAPKKTIEELKKQELPVYIQADTLEYNKAENVYIGTGNVEIKYGSISLKADEAVLNADTGMAVASGNVVLEQKDNRIVGEMIEINLKTKLGTVYQAEMFFAPSYYITGEKIQMLAPDRFLVENGTYSSCDGNVPDWKFKVKRAEVHLEHYAYLHDFSLYMRKIPVFYFPYAPVPIKTDRATGLLIPRLGYSNRDGIMFKESLFWAINKWSDATFLVDYFGRRGAGAGLELRYALTPKNKGKIYSYMIRDRIKSEYRWKNRAEITQNLGYDIKAFLRTDLSSDRKYEQEFAQNIQRRRNQEQDSYLWIHKNWDYYGIDSITQYTKDLSTNYKSKAWRLPELKILSASHRLFDMPLYYNLELSGLNWRRETGGLVEESQRLHMRPQVRIPLNLGHRAAITPKAGYLLSWYNKNENYQTDERGIYELGLRFDGPQWQRNYNTDKTDVKHFFSPFIDYNYIEDEEQGDLLQFDMINNIPPENTIRYGMTHHFLGRFDKTKKIREVLLLTISQKYDIAEYRKDETKENPRRPFSALKFDWEIKPDTDLRLDWEIDYDIYKDKVQKNNIDLWYEGIEDISLKAGWRDANADTNFFNGAVKFDVGHNISFDISGKYNAKEKQWVEDKYSILYKSQCFSVGVSYVNRFDEDEFSFSINLTGLSSM